MDSPLPHRLRIALYQPDIAGNTGTILRMAACLGLAVDVIGPALGRGGQCGVTAEVEQHGARGAQQFEDATPAVTHLQIDG